MNSSKNYKIFYYLCFSFTLIAVSLTQSLISYYDVLFGNQKAFTNLDITYAPIVQASIRSLRTDATKHFAELFDVHYIGILAKHFFLGHIPPPMYHAKEKKDCLMQPLFGYYNYIILVSVTSRATSMPDSCQISTWLVPY